MNDNKKIAINSVVVFIRLIVVSLIGLLTSRIVLDALGASDYGLYNVVGGIVTILNVVNSAMLSTTYRYLAYEVGKKDGGDSNKVFNTSFEIHLAFSILILILGLTVGEWYIDNYLNVPAGRLDDARFVFHISLLSACISTLLVPYQGLLVAYEKFSANALIDIISCVIRFLLIIVLLKTASNRVRLYSIINLSYVIIFSLGYVLYSVKHYCNIIRLKITTDWQLFKEMLSFAIFTLYGALAYVLRSQGSNVLINLFFGTIVNAAYAIAYQVENFILMFARCLNNAAVPQITKNFSGGNSGRSVSLSSYISKYTFILMSCVAFPVLLDMDFLLSIWLHEVPEGASLFCRIMVLGGLFDCLGEGISPLVQASGKIKRYTIIVHSVMLLGLPISFILFKIGLHPVTISVVFCCISLTCSIIKVILLKTILNIDIKLFFKTSYSRILLVCIPLVLFYVLTYSPELTVVGHILFIIGSEIILLMTVLLLGLENKERNMIKTFIK